MDETLFSWIHISDIHFGHGGAAHGWDQVLVLDKLVRDFAKARELGAPHPDVILVTGDIAFAGAKAEYEKARDWLGAAAAAASLLPAQVFVVPGNHDVDRNVDKRFDVGPLMKSLRAGDPLDSVLADPRGRELLADRMREYLRFAAKFAPACLAPAAPAEGELFWVHTLDARGGLRVRLSGLNTAILSSKDPDEKKLQLGNQQLAKALQPAAADGELVVVLTHHPLRDWLADGRDADRWLMSDAHLHLSGHVHEADSEQARHGAGGQIVRVAAGAAHGEPMPEAWVPASHGYNFAAVVRGADGKLRLRIWPRRWAEKTKSFRVDPDVVDDGEVFAEHELRISLPAAAASVTPALTATPAPPGPAPAPTAAPTPAPAPRRADGPLRVFVSFAQPDEAAAAEVEKRLRLINNKYKFKNLPPLLEGWSARSVGAGEVTRSVIAEHLRAADLVVLLVSDDYLASPDLVDGEMLAAMARHARDEARVLPILLRPCDFSDAPFARFRFLPFYMDRDDQRPRPVSAMNRDDAFLEIEKGLQAAAEAWKAR